MRWPDVVRTFLKKLEPTWLRAEIIDDDVLDNDSIGDVLEHDDNLFVCWVCFCEWFFQAVW